MAALDINYWLIAGPIALAGLGIAIWAFFGDQLRRGHRTPRCPACLYNMTGVPGLQCPECGQSAKSESMLFRPYRKRRLSVLAVTMILAAAYYAGVGPAVDKHGPIAAIPTWALAVWVTPDSNNVLHEEILRRLEDSELPLFLQRLLVKRAVTHAIKSEPPLIETRARWPRDVPLRVRIHPNQLMIGHTPRLLIARTAGTDVDTLDIDLGCWGFPRPLIHPVPGWSDDTLELVANQNGPSSAIDLSIARQPYIKDPLDESAARDYLWRSVIQLPVELCDSLDDVLTPVHSPEIDASLRSSVSIGIAVWNNWRDMSGHPWRSYFVLDYSTDAIPKDVSLAFRVEILYKDEIVVSGSFWDTTRRASSLWDTVPLTGDVKRVAAAQKDDPDWSIRISGDAQMALRDFERDKYWAGQITIPLSDAPITRR